MNGKHLHWYCGKENCYVYSAYIRLKSKWTKVGWYYSGCKKFTPDLELNPAEFTQKLFNPRKLWSDV